MRAYVPYRDQSFDYPEEMEKILTYLREHGELRVNAKTVESLYRDFSNTRCAGWLCVNPDTLEQFAEWLSEVDI